MLNTESLQEIKVYKDYSILIHQEMKPTTADVYVAIGKLEEGVYILVEAPSQRRFPLYDGILNHMISMVCEAQQKIDELASIR